MKIRDGFVLRQILNENVVVGEGNELVNFNKLMVLNDSATFLFNSLQPLDSFTTADIVELLLGEYQLDKDTACRDAAKVTEEWRNVGLIVD